MTHDPHALQEGLQLLRTALSVCKEELNGLGERMGILEEAEHVDAALGEIISGASVEVCLSEIAGMSEKVWLIVLYDCMSWDSTR